MMNFLNRLKLRSFSMALAGLLASSLSWAVDPFVIRSIWVEGLQRVEPGTVFATLGLRVGETFTDEKGSAAIRSLFGLGLFKDVRLEVKGEELVVVVEERPVVAQVDFVGIKEFDRDVLRKALRESGLYEGQPFDRALADKAEQELKRQYINRSLYGAQVVTTVTPIERNRVNLTFTVTEGQVARIKELRIVGARAFKESTLLDLFDLNTGGWLSWYTKSDRYSRTKLNADIETLRSYYLMRGYLDFRVDSTQVAIAPDRQQILVTINITEGERFVVSGVSLAGNYLGREEEFKSLVSIKPGQAYNADQVAQTTKAFTDYFGRFGFAFARVEAVPEIDRARNLVAFVLQAEPSRRAYVRRINVAGNTRTRDEVVRREFRQFESSWYDSDRIRISRERVDRLGFFTQVDVETQDVPGTPDQVDLNFTVAEKPTGNLQIGAGYSTSENITLMAAIRQENVFGSGNYLGLEVNTSKSNRQLVLSTVDPYFTADGVSRAFDVFSRTSKPLSGEGADYTLKTQGGNVRFGVPFTENDTVFFGLGAEMWDILPGSNPGLQAFTRQLGSNEAKSFPLSVGWQRDQRDSALVPTRGWYQRLNSDWGVAGDIKYIRAVYQVQKYIPLDRRFTLGLNVDLGWGKGLSGQSYPVIKNFYAGGLGSVRGFEQGSLGERYPNGTAKGGAKKINLNAEMITPFPGAGNDRTLRMFGFVDAGNVFGDNAPMRLQDLRASTGLGVSWISPVGPLRFALARPLRREAQDRIQSFEFQIGTAF
ncbi:MAG: outer membrane protein assembly factor BamA [Betaproteobacteria bacterium]|nr:outer membrane protein assembly factor BamA [Betaproteobacteria bacterium]